MRHPDNLDPEDRSALLYAIQCILWRDENGLADPDKQWSPDTIDAIAREMADYELSPEGK